MTHGVSNGHVTDDVTWPPKVLWGSMVGYPSDSLASCKTYLHLGFSIAIPQKYNLNVSKGSSRILYTNEW